MSVFFFCHCCFWSVCGVERRKRSNFFEQAIKQSPKRLSEEVKENNADANHDQIHEEHGTKVRSHPVNCPRVHLFEVGIAVWIVTGQVRIAGQLKPRELVDVQDFGGVPEDGEVPQI